MSERELSDEKVVVVGDALARLGVAEDTLNRESKALQMKLQAVEVIRAVRQDLRALGDLEAKTRAAQARLVEVEATTEERMAAAVARAVEAERVAKERGDRAVDEAAQLERLRDDTRRELAELREELAPLRAEREAFRKMAATL